MCVILCVLIYKNNVLSYLLLIKIGIPGHAPCLLTCIFLVIHIDIRELTRLPTLGFKDLDFV